TIEKVNVADNTIDINYVISNGPSLYIERIDITGNQRTFDYVIREQLVISEGDAYNQSYLNKSIRNIRNLNFFSDVKVDTLQGSAPDRRIVKISVSEKPTGSLAFGAGYSTLSGVVGTIKIAEQNLLGKGQRVSLDLTLGGNLKS
ncbi:MAG: POTRA domain-containing protein, partial [Hyphomicrobiales bacterium]